VTSPARSPWLEVTLTLPHEWAEAAGNVLLEWGAPGLIEETAGESVLLRAHLSAAPRGFGRRLRAYLRALGEASGVPGPFAARLARRTDPGWASQWRTFHRPLRFGQLVVAPSWCDGTLEPGEVLDGEGGYTVYGRLVRAAESWEARSLPIGLAHGVRLERAIRKGETVTWRDAGALASEAARFRLQMEAEFAAEWGIRQLKHVTVA